MRPDHDSHSPVDEALRSSRESRISQIRELSLTDTASDSQRRPISGVFSSPEPRAEPTSYEQLVELEHPSYQVYRSLAEADHFLIVPRRYRIVRRNYDEKFAYRPDLLSCSAEEEGPDGVEEVYRWTATVMPHIDAADVHRLRDTLTHQAQSEVQIQYPSEICGETSIDWTGVLFDLGPEVGARLSRSGQGYRVALSILETEVSRLRQILLGRGLRVEFTMKLGSELQVESIIDLSLLKIDGPWNFEPLKQLRSAEEVTLINRLDQPLWIWEVLVGTEHCPVEIFALGLRLEAGDTLVIEGVGEEQEVFPLYELRETPWDSMPCGPSLEQRSMIFLQALDLKALAATRLDVEVRAPGLDESLIVTLSDEHQVDQVELLLPEGPLGDVTSFECRVSAWKFDECLVTGPWQERSFRTGGNIYEISMSALS